MKEKKVDQKLGQYVKLYLNDEGELVESMDTLTGKGVQCVNKISFCCTSTVPDGFVFDLNVTSFEVCFDFSQLNCCLETQTTMCESPHPRGGTIVEIQAVRLVGCVRIAASAGDAKPIAGFSSVVCKICCNTTTCVDQIIGFTCGATPPCEPCFENTCGTIEFKVSTDDCGRQVLTVEGDLDIIFTGCDS